MKEAIKIAAAFVLALVLAFISHASAAEFALMYLCLAILMRMEENQI